MEAEDNEIGKQVRIILINDFHYSGIILESSASFIILKDKFGKRVTLNRDSISVMEDVTNGF